MNTVECVKWCQDRGYPAELIGRWVWITFPTKPGAETRAALKSAGFRWCGRRQAWANDCGVKSARARSYHPRDRYGSIPVAALEVGGGA